MSCRYYAAPPLRPASSQTFITSAGVLSEACFKALKCRAAGSRNAAQPVLAADGGQDARCSHKLAAAIPARRASRRERALNPSHEPKHPGGLYGMPPGERHLMRLPGKVAAAHDVEKGRLTSRVLWPSRRDVHIEPASGHPLCHGVDLPECQINRLIKPVRAPEMQDKAQPLLSWF